MKKIIAIVAAAISLCALMISCNTDKDSDKAPDSLAGRTYVSTTRVAGYEFSLVFVSKTSVEAWQEDGDGNKFKNKVFDYTYAKPNLTIKADIDMKTVVDATGFVLDDGTMSVRFEQTK